MIILAIIAFLAFIALLIKSNALNNHNALYKEPVARKVSRELPRSLQEAELQSILFVGQDKYSL